MSGAHLALSINDLPSGWGPGKVVDAERLQSPAFLEGSSKVGYDNSASGLVSTNVQGALDELATGVAAGAQVFRVPFTFADGTLVLYLLQVGETVRDCAVIVTTAFDDPTATCTVGVIPIPGVLLDSAESALSVAGRYAPSNDYFAASAQTMRLVLTPAASTQGAGYVLFTVGG